MNLSLALQMDSGEPVWLAAQGTSMLPWPRRGSELRIEPVTSGLAPGTIIVFRRGAKLYYHRIVERLGLDQWRTKGDTLILPDEPVSGDQIVGCVTGRRRGGRVWPVRGDREAAWLSVRLGRCFGWLELRRPRGLRHAGRALYLCLLLLAWPFRRILAPRLCRGDAGEPTGRD